MVLNCPKCGSPLASGAADQLDCPRCSSAVFLPAVRTAPAAARAIATGFDPRAFLAARGEPTMRPPAGSFFARRHIARPTARALSPMLFILVATGTAILFLGSALLFRAPFVEAHPAPFFGSSATEFDIAGLAIRNVEASRIVVGEQPILLLGGELTNTGNRAVAVPALRVSLNDGGAEIFAWTVQPEESTLAAGATLSFKSRVAAPARAGSLELSFVAPQ